MQLIRTTAVGWAVATIVLGTVATGCLHNDTTPSPSSAPPSSVSSSTASDTVTGPTPGQPTDYSALLIKPIDVGPDVSAPQPPVLNPNNAPGVAQLFVNADKSRRMGEFILILADPAAAAAAVEKTKNNYNGKVSGTWQPVDVGSNGTMISGASPDNSQSITVLLFTEGRALVNMEFDGPPNDPMDPGYVADIGRRQDAAIKERLPG